LDDRLKNTLTPHGKKMHVKEIYVMFIQLFDSGILLSIDLNKKKGKKEEGGGVNFFCEFYSSINVMFRQFKVRGYQMGPIRISKICCMCTHLNELHR
jgi:hypothetical protein